MSESSRPPFFERYQAILFVGLAAVVLVGIIVLLRERPDPTTITVIPPKPTLIPSVTYTPSATPTPGPYAVYITGAVFSPDIVVTLPYGSRVSDAVTAAGGPLDTADLEHINLAQRLEDGDQVHVPTSASGETRAVPFASTVWVVTPTPGAILVYVVGEVKEPESMVSVPVGSRVQDAIDAAGGVTDMADLTQVNLSQILNDGDLIYIPAYGDTSVITPTANHLPVVHINYAGLEELMTLPGIGESLAQAIIDHRTEYGLFGRLEDLDAVPGLGAGKLDDIRQYIVID